MPSQTSEAACEAALPRRSSGLRKLGAVLGLALLLAAVVLLWNQHEVVANAYRSIKERQAAEALGLVAVLAGSMVVNLFLTGLLFSVLMSRYGRVGLAEMQALIATATLLNYVPLRPGLFGRFAYHKAYNQIPISNSAVVVLQSMALSLASAAYMLLALVAKASLKVDLTYMAIAPLPGVAALALLMPRWRIWLWAAVIRHAEFIVIAIRYWAAFELIGSPIDVQGAVAFASLSVVASMVPLAGNGLGLREWVVGLVTPVLTSHQMELGIAADLLNRAGEMVIAFVAGSLGAFWLTRLQLASRGP